MKTGHRIRRVRYLAPAPYGVEMMTLGQLRRMAPAGYLQAPQRPAFHLLILIRSGRGSHTVDFQDYLLDRGHAVWVRPGQVQRFSDVGTATGDLVLFQPDFLIPGTRAAAVADDRGAPVGYHVPKSTHDRFDQAKHALREEYSAALRDVRTGDVAQAETLRHLLSVLVLRLTATTVTPAPADGAAILHERFRNLLERDYAAAHDVDRYASALGYSARTLSRATHTVAGRSPKQMIQDRIALEAARLLAHSALPVASIATTLSFRDASNFSSFFTRHTGTTPTEFRRQQRL